MMSTGASAAGLAQAHNQSEMKRRRAVFILGGHGAKDEGSKRLSRRGTDSDPFLALRGDTNVIIFTPVGDSREGVSSGQILKKGVYTNTSLAPSIAVALVCGKDKCDRRMLLNKMAEQLKLHDTLADIVYTNPGNLFQINPIEDKNVWQIYMGEQFRQPDKGATKVTFARVAAGDEIHFPFGLTFLTLYDENGSLYEEPLLDSEGQPTIASFMLEHNCDLIKATFLKKPDLLKKLEEIDSIVTDIVEPFAQSATKGVKTHWADLNLLSSRNSGQINRAITKIADAAESRIKSGTGTEHDEWLVANRELVIFFLNEVQTTKQSKLSKLVFICKYILLPGIDIEIVDLTCSSDFTEQPKWGAVNVPTPDSVGSYKDQADDTDATSSASSSVLSLSDVNIDADIHEESSWRDALLNRLWSGWEGFTSFVSAGVARAAPPPGGAGAVNKRHASGGSRKSRKRTTPTRKKITRKTKKRAYKKKSQKRNRRK